MELAKAALTSFVLIDADWPAERARSLIERLDPSHVIIRRTGPPEDHYLLTSDRVMSQLVPAAESIPVGQVLRLSKLTPVPLIEADMESSSAPVRLHRAPGGADHRLPRRGDAKLAVRVQK